MIGSVQSLANMEWMLYGNTPAYGNLSAPSIVNNYCTGMNNSMYGYPYTNSYMNPYMNQNIYGAYNPTFGQSVTSPYTQQNTNTQENSVFTGLSAQEQNALVKDYTKSMAPSESLMGATAGAVGFSLLFHPRTIVHPINTYKSFAKTKEIFKGITEPGTKLAEAWAKPEYNEVLRDAYAAMNRIDARSLKGKGLHIRRAPFESGEYEALQNIMKKAVENFDPAKPETVKELLEATESLNRANVKNGLLPRGWNKVKNLVRGTDNKLPSALESAMTKPAEDAGKAAKGLLGRLLNNSSTEKATAETLSKGSKTYLQTLKTSGGGIAGAIFFLGMEYVLGAGKIKDAFNKDSKTGWAQLGQTTVNGIGSAAGWAAGEALGTWGCAKLLAKAGTKIKPGLGTAIGAIAGMVVGSIGCWFTGKITHKIVGQDVADKVQAENMLATTDGQVQLLQNTIQRMEKGEKVDPQAQMAVQKILAEYSAAA